MPTETFQVITDETDGFHYLTNATTGERVRGYPLRKTALRAARNANEACAPATGPDAEVAGEVDLRAQETAAIAEANAESPADFLARVRAEAQAFTPAIDPPATSSPVLGDAPVTFSDDQIDVEDIAPTGQRPAPNVPMIETREAWLMAASVMIGSGLAQRADLELPAYRVTCGWPSTKATAKSKRRIGECWNPEASADAHAEIFISPLCADPLEVIAILAHELIHAALPKGTAHKAPFVKAAKAIGFVKPFTQITTTPELVEWTQEVVDALPAYPHAAMSLQSEGAKKPQVNRQLLAKCEQDFDGEACGYQCRLARKWIVEVGAPICPRCREPMVCEGLETVAEELPEGEGDE